MLYKLYKNYITITMSNTCYIKNCINYCYKLYLICVI